MRQHPRPTYGKARGQWPPQLDKGDSSAQFHGQMESARRLSLTVEFSAPLRCVWQRVSLAREIFFMQGMKNGTKCTLSREMKRCPAQSRTANAIDTTHAPRKDVAAPAARPKGRPRKKAAQKTPTSHSGGQRGTSTWWYKIPAHGERARCNFVLHNAILLARAAGGEHPSSFAAYASHGLTHNGGLSSRRLSPLRCILALTVPVVRGLATLSLLCRRLARGGLYGRSATLDQQTVYLLVSDIILQELAVVNPPPYPNATSRIIITVKPAAKASAPGPGSPRVGSSSAATT